MRGSVRFEQPGEFVRKVSFEVLEGELFFPVPLGSGSALYLDGVAAGEVSWTGATSGAPGSCASATYSAVLETAAATPKTIRCDGIEEITFALFRDHPESFSEQPEKKQAYLRELADRCGCPELIVEGGGVEE